MRPTAPNRVPGARGAAVLTARLRSLAAGAAALTALTALASCGLLPHTGGAAGADGAGGTDGTTAASPDGASRDPASGAPGQAGDAQAPAPLNPLEYGGCSAQEVAEAQDEQIDPEDLDATNDRATAQAQIDHELTAAPTVLVPADTEALASTVHIPAGTSEVVIEASNLVYVIDSDLETLTVRGSGNTIWVNSVRRVVFEQATITRGGVADIDSGYFNLVLWRDAVPVSEQDDSDSNTVARDSLAPVVAFCPP